MIGLTDGRGRLLWVSAARPGRSSEITACRHDQLTAKLRAAGLGAIADLDFVGLDDSGPNADRAPVEHGFAHLKNWWVLGKVRTAPKRATTLVGALLVLTDHEVSR
ncbi:hypothetical protein GCM10010415_38090 [Streptomyces atrovirens]